MAIPRPAQYASVKKVVVSTLAFDALFKVPQALPFGTLTISSRSSSDCHAAVKVGYDVGVLRLNAGEPSGNSFFIESDFHLPTDVFVTITIKLKQKLKPRQVLGYSINSSGNLSPVDTAVNIEENSVSFNCFLPVFMTWIYI